MKKIFITLSLVVVALNLSSQNGPPWKPTGNTASAGDFLGTTNNFPLLFYTNNTQQMSLGTNGVFSLNSLTGIGNRVLVADANGNLTALPTSVSNALTAWDSNGSNVFFNGGNLGIGTSSPSYKLDVIGDARISNNLYVGGGIIVTDKLDASVHVKAGDVIVNNDLSVAGNARLSGALTALQGIMFDATNNRGISFTPASLSSRASFNYGNQTTALATCITPNTGNSDPFHIFTGFVTSRATNGQVNSAVSIGSAPWDGNGIIEVEGTDQLGGTNNGLMINYFCGRNTLINVNNGLPNGGGTVFMGSKVDMAGSVKIGYSGNATFDPNTSIELFNGGNANWNGIKFTTPWSGSKVISIANSNFPVSPFTLFADGRVNLSTVGAYNNQKIFSLDNLTLSKTVFEILGTGKTSLNIDPSLTSIAFEVNDVTANKNSFKVLANGRTEIHVQNPTANDKPFYIVDDFNNKDIFLVKSDGKVYAREVEISLATSFPDYVFKSDYKLKSLNEVECFIKMNKHLPGFEKGEHYEKNGININEMLIKQQEKIEEYALYLIEMKKEITDLKKELESLKK